MYESVRAHMGVTCQIDGWRGDGYKNGEIGVKYVWLWDTLPDLVNWREKQVFETAKCKVF